MIAEIEQSELITELARINHKTKDVKETDKRMYYIGMYYAIQQILSDYFSLTEKEVESLVKKEMER